MTNVVENCVVVDEEAGLLVVLPVDSVNHASEDGHLGPRGSRDSQASFHTGSLPKAVNHEKKGPVLVLMAANAYQLRVRTQTWTSVQIFKLNEDEACC